jgi:hypothetical protein
MLWRNLSVSDFFTAAVPITAVLLAVFNHYNSQSDYLILHKKIDSSPAFTHDINFGKLEIKLDGAPVDNIFQCTTIVKNVGRQSLLASDFVHGFRFRMPEGVINIEFDNNFKNRAGIIFENDFSITSKEPRLIILNLHPDEYISFKFYFKKQSDCPDIDFAHNKISGKNIVTEYEDIPNRIDDIQLWTDSFSAIVPYRLKLLLYLFMYISTSIVILSIINKNIKRNVGKIMDRSIVRYFSIIIAVMFVWMSIGIVDAVVRGKYYSIQLVPYSFTGTGEGGTNFGGMGAERGTDGEWESN